MISISSRALSSKTFPKTPRSLAQLTKLTSIPEESHSRSRKDSYQNKQTQSSALKAMTNANHSDVERKNYTCCLITVLLIVIAAIVLLALFILRLQTPLDLGRVEFLN